MGSLSAWSSAFVHSEDTRGERPANEGVFEMKVLDARVEVAERGRDKWLKVLVDEHGQWANALTPGAFPVHLTDDPKVWERNHTFFAERLPLSVAQDTVEQFCPDWTLEHGYLERSGVEWEIQQDYWDTADWEEEAYSPVSLTWEERWWLLKRRIGRFFLSFTAAGREGLSF